MTKKRVRTKREREAEKIRQREKRREEIKDRPRCSICGEPFAGRSWDSRNNRIRSRITEKAGFHQKCAPVEWMKVYSRETKAV